MKLIYSHRKGISCSEAGGGGVGRLHRTAGILGVEKMFYILIVVTQVCTIIKTYQIVCLKWVLLSVCKISLNKVSLKKSVPFLSPSMKMCWIKEHISKSNTHFSFHFRLFILPYNFPHIIPPYNYLHGLM